jgi:D-alanine-D-alanine ligase
MTRTIAIVHNAVTNPALPDEADVLVQVEAVSRALTDLGYRPVPVPCDLNLAALAQALEDIRPLGVFNLVESLENYGSLIHVVPSLLAALNIPYTGCPAQAVYATSHKVMAKERLHLRGLPTPAWINPFPADMPWQGALCPEGNGYAKNGHTAQKDAAANLWIIKSLWEHASLGLETENLVTGTAADVKKQLALRAKDLGGACFAEQFIQGREFNLSLLGSRSGVRVLPPAEIQFLDIPADQPAMVGYRAKWLPDAKEFHNTPRRFDFPGKDAALVSALESLACRCWQNFNLQGYARVDFRVDALGNPFILEINTNPCLSPDAGFAAALDRAKICFADGINQIVNLCLC